MNEDSPSSDVPLLSALELRVLGVLIEKSLTQASGYPMTVNALVSGANQKQNRDPVVDYDEGDIEDALDDLRAKGLVVQVMPGVGARVTRYRHAVLDVYGWDRRAQAVMAELMLRGRQTVGELRTRASRMSEVPDIAAASTIIKELMSCSPPYVQELAREPGRSANRFRHLLGEDDDEEENAVAAPAAVGVRASKVDSVDLVQRVERLEEQVAVLTDIVNQLRDSSQPDIDEGGDSGV